MILCFSDYAKYHQPYLTVDYHARWGNFPEIALFAN